MSILGYIGKAILGEVAKAAVKEVTKKVKENFVPYMENNIANNREREEQDLINCVLQNKKNNKINTVKVEFSQRKRKK